MSVFKRGDVIAISFFPNQEDKNEGTARYVLIVDVYSDGFCIIPFTKQTHQSKNYEKTISISKDSGIGIKMGLKYNSILMIDRRMDIKKIIAKPPVLGNCGEDFIDEHDL